MDKAKRVFLFISSILGWLFGVLFIASGMLSLYEGKADSPVLWLLVFGIYIIPQARKKIIYLYKKIKPKFIKLVTNPKLISSIVLILIVWFFVWVFSGDGSSKRDANSTFDAPVENSNHSVFDILQRRIFGEMAVKSRLKDPDSVVFKDVNVYMKSSIGTPVICGRVNSKNGFGGYTGLKFFITNGLLENTYFEKDTPDFKKLWDHLCKDK